MNKTLLGLITVLLVASVQIAAAQPSVEIPRIGFLSSYSPTADRDRIDAFREGLRDLGYIEEKNFRIDYRYTGGRRDRLAKLAAELVALKVNVIVAGGGSNLVRVIKQTTTGIPIVMTGGSDPVAGGLISSLARPGGNVTGLTSLTLDLSGKRIELLKEAVPALSRIGVLYDAGNPAKISEFRETQAAARTMGVEIKALELRSPGDLESVFNSAGRTQAHGIIALQSPLTVGNRKQIAALARKARLPLMVAERGLLDAGGLMSYGPDYADLYRRAALYVDKILKGTTPADLPVEQPITFQLVINLKTAKQIGLTIPPNVLARADRVIR